MENQVFDVVIVGLGPLGSATAIHLAAAALQCAGAVPAPGV